MDPATMSAHLLDHVPFHVAIGVTLALDAILMGWLSWAYRSPRFAAYLLREPLPMKVSPANYRWTVGTTGALSTLSTIGLVYGLAPFTVSTAPIPIWQSVLQFAGVLLVYDFAYYFMHRFMHIKALMPFVHAVHHRVRFPSAAESLYLSPIEMLAGLGLLMAVTALIGPIHWTAFAALFFVYSTLHIVIHSGMAFPHRAFGVINYLTLKHHKHHLNKHGHNYASVTPLPDLLFRTSI